MGGIIVNREDRAKQFMPFDAVKGLRQALAIKEYENERISRGDISEEKAIQFSNILINLKNDDILWVKYFCDGHYIEIQGNATLDVIKNTLRISGEEFNLEQIVDMRDMKINNK